jgi:hypothetical protein
MRFLNSKYKIWQIMLATAIVACLFAAFRMPRAAEISGAIFAVTLPIVLARRGRKLRTAAWVCSLYPLYILGSFYAIWLTAGFVLGHRPRIGLDHSDHISRIVQGPIKLNHAFILGLPVVLFLIGPLVLIHDVQSFRSEGLHPNRTVARWVIPALVWLGAFGIVWFRLFGVAEILDWYWD